MKTQVAAIAGASALAVAAFAAGDMTSGSSPSPAILGPGTTQLAEGQYVGPCSIVTPPDADPCQAAQLVLRYQVFGDLVNTAYFPKWKRANPGELARLKTIMAAPKCSTATNPQPQTLVTFYGAMLGDIVEAYACALGSEPIAFPTPNPPAVAGSTDKSPPTAPGPVTITPEPANSG